MKHFFILSAFAFCIALSAQEKQERVPSPNMIQYRGRGNYSLVERTDLRRYDNGRYTGLLSREVRSFIAASPAPQELASQMRQGGTFYDGDFYVKEETMRDRRKAAGSINTSIPSAFCITPSGELKMIEDNGYPSFRSFPAFSSSPVKMGDKWRADAVRACDPLCNGMITRMPIHVEYTYIGNDEWNGEEVFVLSAKWATRYGGTHGGGDFGGYVDSYGDPSLLRAEGSHNATMYISRKTGAALVVRDKVDETFIYETGNAVSFKGSIALFTEYPPSIDRKSLIPALQRAGIASTAEAAALAKGERPKAGENGKGKGKSGKGSNGDSGKAPFAGKEGADKVKGNNGKGNNGKGEDRPQDSLSETAAAAIAASNDNGGKDSKKTGASSQKIKVEDTDSGVRLTIEDLRFLPDSAELLPAERGRVAAIASVLREVPLSMFMVEGHTASTGNPRGEQNLSEERARSIAKALSAYGIDAGRFICKGSGGRKPIADNSTPQGKAQNRRVEITILE